MVEVPVDGRLYCRNIPGNWQWYDVYNWVDECGCPRPSYVGVVGRGMDCQSVFIHLKATMSELQQYSSLLNGHYLTHKATYCEVSLERPSQKAKAPWLK